MNTPSDKEQTALNNVALHISLLSWRNGDITMQQLKELIEQFCQIRIKQALAPTNPQTERKT